MNKKTFNLEDPRDVEYLINNLDVNDDMAVDSDLEGDEDAEDNLPNGTVNTRSNSSLHSEMENDDGEEEEVNDSANNEDEPSIRDVSSDNEEESSSSSADEEYSSWKRVRMVPKTYKTAVFDQKFGISNKRPNKYQTPSDFFFYVLTPIFMNFVVQQSNLYADQNNVSLNLTFDELKAFIGMLIIMGFHTLPSMRLYWSSDSNFSFSRIRDVMPLRRFLKIVRYLHLNDNQNMPKKGEKNYDRLYKIRPFIDYVSKRFPLIFQPSRYLSVDESMVKFKGRSALKQYMPMKPIKRGFKMWVIACGVTGYCLGMSLYEGADETRDKNISLGEFVVSKLSAVFEGCWYCLFFDNFFSSVPLAKRLLEKKFFSCATIRSNRKFFPKGVLKTDKDMRIGDYDGCIEGTEISISKWKDRGKKSVAVISTMHDPLEISQVHRTQKDGSRLMVSCPVSIKDYNQYMGGVDHFDQLHSMYNVSWKSRRWWMRIFYYTLEACIVNSFILYKNTINKTHPNIKPLPHLKFRSVLATELIGAFSSRAKRGPASQTGRARKRKYPDGRQTLENSLRLTNVGHHLPIKGTRRRCAHCSTAKNQQRSSIQCIKCNVALCLECFYPFHSS